MKDFVYACVLMTVGSIVGTVVTRVHLAPRLLPPGGDIVTMREMFETEIAKLKADCAEWKSQARSAGKASIDTQAKLAEVITNRSKLIDQLIHAEAEAAKHLTDKWEAEGEVQRLRAKLPQTVTPVYHPMVAWLSATMGDLTGGKIQPYGPAPAPKRSTIVLPDVD